MCVKFWISREFAIYLNAAGVTKLVVLTSVRNTLTGMGVPVATSLQQTTWSRSIGLSVLTVPQSSWTASMTLKSLDRNLVDLILTNQLIDLPPARGRTLTTNKLLEPADFLQIIPDLAI